MSDLTVALRQVVAARHPEDLFPVDTDAPVGEQAEQLKQSFRRLVRLVHPDVNGNAAGAAAAFVKLERLYSQAQAALGAGAFGERGPAPTIIRGSHASYVLGEQVGADDVADEFSAFANGRMLTVQIARDPADNDLVERQAEALRPLRDPDAVEARLNPYVPELVDLFTVPGDAGARAAAAFAALDGFVSLRQIRAAYPDGVHWRDMAWMFRRILVAAGFAHANGFVHGAVVPEHVWIHPTDHGLVLRQWIYHAPIGDPLAAVPHRYRSWYPAEALGRAPVGPELDVLFAVRCAQYLLGPDVGSATTPPRLRTFLAGGRSSDDAWELLEDFDRLIGPREYRPFRMPAPTTDTPSSGGTSAAQPSERG